MSQQPVRDVHADLDKAVSPPRMKTFSNAAKGDLSLARRLYVWNRDLSVAFLADVAILEVALRNAMHEAAVRTWGGRWYADPQVRLDDRSLGQLSTAWRQLPAATRAQPADPDLPGRLVAQCMFGFWTNLLDAGAYVGKDPRRFAVDYDILWHAAFKQAFPGGRAEARSQRVLIQQHAARQTQIQAPHTATFTRAWVHGICKNVNELRNRVAHHEPLINGFPLNGQSRRVTAAEGHEDCRMLARMLDRDLATWLDGNTTVLAVLSARPT